MSRLPSLERHQLDAAQLKVHESIAGLRGGVRGPFKVLLANPELASRIEQVGAYARYQCSVPQRLRELSILTVAAFWQADYEWSAHAPIARALGLEPAVIEAIGQGARPDFRDQTEKTVHDFTHQLLTRKHVTDGTFAAAKEALGAAGVLDLTGLVGYYTMLALVINVAEVEVPDDSDIPWRRQA